MSFDLSTFIKLDVSNACKGSGTGMDFISIPKKSKKIVFSAHLSRACPFEDGDRVDLYRSSPNGALFVLKREAVGCVTVRKLTKSADNLYLPSQAVYLQVAPFAKFERVKAWVDDGMVFFKIDEEPTK